jgi:hypothetical protein
MSNQTFYINGRAPPYSTAKPVRFIVARKDNELKHVSLPELTWDMCHDYANWTGPIKVPAVCQMAHKLGEWEVKATIIYFVLQFWLKMSLI